jgi:hypothetical protein
MSFLKRATPWMVTMTILLGLYVASYHWYYKPKRMLRGVISSTKISSKDKRLDQLYLPMFKMDEERLKQKIRNELLGQCQGEWQGYVRPRSEELINRNQSTQVHATIKGDQFKITWAETMPELVGATWKIGSAYDSDPQFGFSFKAYPRISSIFFIYSGSPTDDESLYEVTMINAQYFGPMIFNTFENGLSRFVAPVSTTTTKK